MNFLINLVLLQIEYAVSQKRVTCENTKAFFYYQRFDAMVHFAYESQAADMGVLCSYLDTCKGATKSHKDMK